MALPVAIPIAMTALSALGGFEKRALARRQQKQAEELARIKMTKYEIPTAATEALQLAKLQALKTRLPGQNLIENRMGATTGAAIRTATETAVSPVEALAAGSAAYANQQNTLGDLAIQGANMYQQNQANLQGQFGNYAGWQEKQQQWNTLDPYLRAKAAESALRYGAEANRYSGNQQIYGAAAMGLDMLNQSGYMDNLFKSTSPPTETSGMNTSNIFNPASTTAPYNYPFENAFPTFTPLDNPNNMGGGNMKEIVTQRFIQRYGRMPSPQELAQLGYN